MAIFLPDFEWFRCPDGYRVARAGEIAPGASNPEDLWIAPRSKQRISYRPLEKYDLLYVAFANVKTPDELADFVKLYGPLANALPDWGDSISAFLRTARLFRDLLHYKALGPKALMSFWISREKASRRAADLAPPDDIRSLNRLVGTVLLVPDRKKGVRLLIDTEVLIAALWWQLAQKLSGDAIIRECRHCGILFEAGPSTRLRADATFCSSEHSVRFHSFKRTRGV
jgi:hypothetical protein